MKYYSDFETGHRAMLIAMCTFTFAAIFSGVLQNVTLVIWCLGCVLASFCVATVVCIAFCAIMHSRILKHGIECIATITRIDGETILYGLRPTMSRVLHIDIQLADEIKTAVYTFVEDVQRNVGDNLRVLVYKDRFIFI